MNFIYNKTNKDWEHEKKSKFGYVHGNNVNLINRINDSKEEHSELSKFDFVYAFIKTSEYLLNYNEIDKIISLVDSNPEKISILEKIYKTKFPLLRQLGEHLVKSQTKQSNEFIYETGWEILRCVLEKEFPLMGLELVKIYEESELDEINSASKKRSRDIIQNDHNNLLQILSDSRKIKPSIPQYQKKDEYKWWSRQYQTNIIAYGYDKLMDIHKLYLELATGAGKSLIVYNLISKINPDTIIILSPRKKINTQNTGEKYLQILNNNYNKDDVFNCSKDKDFKSYKEKCEKNKKKVIIVACSSNKDIYDMIIDNKLQNIFVWFDEAHHTVENWVKTKDEDNNYRRNNFLLTDNEYIKNRVYTSASPDKKLVNDNIDTFGDLYCEIKVKDLIAQEWLCPILPFMFATDSIGNTNKYNLYNFKKQKCSHGFSFHNSRENALSLFYQHYETYKNKETDIKPFLLLGDDFKNDKLSNISLNYDYDCSDEFEKNTNSIAYICDLFKMGYDFDKLDYLIFSDPKVSWKDIIQCIGRGTRPDKKGPDGKNESKTLKIFLPVFINENDTKYDNIVNVLGYLIEDIGIEFDNIERDYKLCGNSCNKENATSYDGNNDIDAVLLDLVQRKKYSNWTRKKIIELLMHEDIHTRIEYKAFITNRPEFNLPVNPFDKFPDFTFEQTYKKSPYYTKDEAKTKYQEFKEKLEEEEKDIEEIDDLHLYLNQQDNKFPPIALDDFYGEKIY